MQPIDSTDEQIGERDFGRLMKDQLYQIHYPFWFNKDDKKEFKIIIDPKTIIRVSSEQGNKADRTRLEYMQCKSCPPNKTDHPYCPTATDIEMIVEDFRDNSHEKCLVKCVTPERTYQKQTSLMEGFTFLLGLVMATIRCPVMFPYRPMAGFHLPFSTVEETPVRATSMYLLRQYFGNKNNI